MAGTLFGTDGIRAEAGVWPLTADFVLKLGRAVGEVLIAEGHSRLVLIGRDTRCSGPMLQAALTAGLVAGGAAVLDLGIIPTAAVAYLTRRLGAGAGVVVSASHNPASENGIKFFAADGFKLTEQVEAEIERLAREGGQMVNRPSGRELGGRDLAEIYLDGLVSEQKGLRLDGLVLAVDCANGAAAALAPECFARLGAQVVAVNAAPTGLNINAQAGSEHVRRRPAELARAAREAGANFALAFDGDADRVVFVDERGRLVDGDHLLGILAAYLDARRRLAGRTIVTTFMRNAGLARFAGARDIVLHETPVGDKYVMEKLRQAAPLQAGEIGLGGEQAGHIILLDWQAQYPAGDGLRTALFALRAWLESGAQTLAELADQVGKTPQVIASAYVGSGSRLGRAELDELAAQAQNQLPALRRIHLRYSGTEPLFRAMLETDDENAGAALGRLAAGLCRKIQAAAGVSNGWLEILDCARGGLIEPL